MIFVKREIGFVPSCDIGLRGEDPPERVDRLADRPSAKSDGAPPGRKPERFRNQGWGVWKLF